MQPMIACLQTAIDATQLASRGIGFSKAVHWLLERCPEQQLVEALHWRLCKQGEPQYLSASALCCGKTSGYGLAEGNAHATQEA